MYKVSESSHMHRNPPHLPLSATFPPPSCLCIPFTCCWYL